MELEKGTIEKEDLACLENIEWKILETKRILHDVRTRESFISYMDKDIRERLQIIVDSVSMLTSSRHKFSDEEILKCSNSIESNAAILRKTINDILLSTLMQNTNMSAVCKSWSVKSLLDLAKWQDARSIVERRHNVVEMQDGGEDVMVNVDEKMMATIMDNLIYNASMFSKEGSKICISWKKVDDGVEISVKDEGIGIESKYFDAIFERYFKIDKSNSGCGLGLFFCRTYIEMMRGTIRVSSIPGEGSTFTLKLNS